MKTLNHPRHWMINPQGYQWDASGLFSSGQEVNTPDGRGTIVKQDNYLQTFAGQNRATVWLDRWGVAIPGHDQIRYYFTREIRA